MGICSAISCVAASMLEGSTTICVEIGAERAICERCGSIGVATKAEQLATSAQRTRERSIAEGRRDSWAK